MAAPKALDEYKEWAYSGKALALCKLGRWSEAAKTYLEAIRHEKERYAHRSFNNLGYCFDEMGLYEEAIAAYDDALKLKPDYTLAHNNKAATLIKWGAENSKIPHTEKTGGA